MERISLAVQTLYAELLEVPRGVTRLAGSLYEKEISGARYLYNKETIGWSRHDRYIGKVGTPETEAHRRDILSANEISRQRRELVRMLKLQLPVHLDQLSRMMLVLQRFGILDSPKTVLVGTNAYICYPALVGSKLDHAVMTTDDADLATLDLATSEGTGKETLLSILQYVDQSFRAVPEMSKKSMPSRFIADSGLRLDIITQQRSNQRTGTIDWKQLSAGATPLQHVEWLIKSPARAVILNDLGALVYVPQPARFAMHKLILAQKRTSVDRLKRQKDLLQAKSLILALNDTDPAGLRDAYDDACAQGKKGWVVPLQLSLSEITLTHVFG